MKTKLLTLSLLIILVACKKKETPAAEAPPQNNTQNNPPLVTSNTVTIKMHSYGVTGYLYMDWDYIQNDPNFTPDSVYTTGNSYLTLIRVLESDSIRVRWYAQSAPNTPYQPSDIDIFVNGTLKQTWTNDMGSTYRYFKIK